MSDDAPAVTAIRAGNKTTLDEIKGSQESLKALRDNPPVMEAGTQCQALPRVVDAELASLSAHKRVIRNQETIASLVINGGNAKGRRSVSIGPLKISGYAANDVVRMVGVLLLAWIALDMAGCELPLVTKDVAVAEAVSE